MKNKPCKHFKCTDADTCVHVYNGECTGSGFDGHEHCGCDLCKYNHVLGPYLLCSYPDNHDMREEIYDWDSEYDFIKNP